MKKLILTALLVMLPVTALQAMTVAAFLQKADALKSRGPLALLSSDLGLLKAEVKNAATGIRAEQTAARAAGRSTPYCLPERASLEANELLTFFRTIPPAQRARTEVRDAFRQYVTRKYPCR